MTCVVLLRAELSIHFWKEINTQLCSFIELKMPKLMLSAILVAVFFWKSHKLTATCNLFVGQKFSCHVPVCVYPVIGELIAKSRGWKDYPSWAQFWKRIPKSYATPVRARKTPHGMISPEVRKWSWFRNFLKGLWKRITEVCSHEFLFPSKSFLKIEKETEIRARLREKTFVVPLWKTEH